MIHGLSVLVVYNLFPCFIIISKTLQTFMMLLSENHLNIFSYLFFFILCLLIFNAFMIIDFSYVCIIFELP